MARPLIGLTTYVEQARYGVHDRSVALLPYEYVQAVHTSGGQAVLITPQSPDLSVLEHLDGIIFTGGADIEPQRYGQEPHSTTMTRPDRDEAEFALLRAAVERDLPMLGICRGMQLMTVAFGGTLHQHLPDVLGHERHRVQGGEHPVIVVSGTKCHKIFGDDTIVNTWHHQGVADPGSLVAAAWSPADSLLEAVEDPRLTFAIGVQWHPEASDDWRLFAALVEAATPGRR